MTYYYHRSPPRKVKGGIKARGGRKHDGASWWARRWMETIDSFDIGERASRGRSYARRGQVKSLDIRSGRVDAAVQGSSRRAYRVNVGISTIPESEWGRLAETLFARPSTASELLAGRMPDDMERVFKKVGADLFPSKSDINTECTCPDWSNPCKHIVAVLFLLGEEFERDPFLIFRMRGTERDDLLKMAGLRPMPGQAGRGGSDPPDGHDSGDLPPEPLPADPDKFWGQDPEEYDLGDVFIPKVHAVLPKQLGSFPFWRGNDDFILSMEKIYSAASHEGIRAFLKGVGEVTRIGNQSPASR